MAELTLNLNIDPIDLPVLLGAGLNITLAKPVGTSEEPSVLWQVFRPFPANTVTWEESYGVYASNTQISNGATIRQIAQRNPADDNAVYPFTPANIFGQKSEPGAGLGTYSITNQNNFQPAFTFGLTQGAKIDGVDMGFKPINAQSVPFNFPVTNFTPLTTVFVWLQANAQSETILTEVVSNKTRVVFGGSTTSQTLNWDPTRAAFVPAGEFPAFEITRERSIYELTDNVELQIRSIL